MTDAPCTIIQTTQVIEDTHVIITLVNPEGQQQSSLVSSGFISNMLNLSPDTSIDSIFNLNTESTSLLDVSVTTIAEPPLSSATTLPPPTIPLIIHMQQTPAPTPTTIPIIRDEAQAESEDFINNLDDNIKKTIKDQVKEQVKAQVSKILPKIKKIVNEQLKAGVLTRSSNESKTSHAVAANLSEPGLKKILIDKMESNKSIHRSDEQKNLYKALVDAYKSDKLILDTYGDTVSFKRRQDNEDKDEESSAGSNQGSKRRRAGKEPESTSVPKEKTSKTTGKSTEGSKSHPQFVSAATAYTKNQCPMEIAHLDWITIHRDDDKLYKFKEGDFNRLHIQDIKDMLLLLVQGKLTNLTIEERLAFNVSLRMFTRSIVIQRRVEDLQLGVESYQKKLNLTKPNTYRSDLKQREAYTAYSNPRGFIYQNKVKKNRLMRIDEQHKFSDGILNDVWTAFDDRLKGIRMKYLSQTI
ncbi:hypothetical protein Tco_0217597 [Tanacetum coccineum]